MGGLKEWLSDNLRYILIGLAIVLVGIVIVFAVKLTGGSGKKTSDSETGSQTIETGTETQAQTETEEALTENDLTVLETVQKYYTAMGNKDLDTLSGMTESLSDSDKQKIESSIIQSYNNIAVYSKKGPVDNSYVVFAYYEAKVGDVEELVPSVVCLYLKPDENGGLCVADWKSDQDTNDYIEKVIQNSDVQALIKDVNDKYQEIVSGNDELQKIVVRSLNADGQAVDALLAQELQSVETDAVRVDLNSDLRVKPDVAVELEGVEYLYDAVRAVEAGRAAAEIYGIDLVVLYRLRRLVKMREQRFVVLRHQMLAARERIEVAVAAFAGAEGYVYIYSQTFSHGQSP